MPHISLAQAIFPDRLKFAPVKPIFTNGSKYEPSNYRPISLLSTFSKVFEKVIYNRMYEHIDRNRILDDNQDGFIRFEVFTAVTMKNGVFWVVPPCGSCKSHMA
jgi:hypothetical protein